MKRKELLKVLENVKPAITSSDMTDSMSYFFFSGKNIITYNDHISIQHPFKTDFTLFVKATDLYKTITKLNTDEISLTEKDGKLNVKCNKMNANLSTIHDEEIVERIKSVQNSLRKAKWKELPNDFSDGISLCSFIASKQESDQTLTCVLIDGTDCISSDNKRVSHAILGSSVERMLIKATEIKNLTVLNPIKYATQKAWVHFRNSENCIFSIRRVEGQFPDFLQFFDFEGVNVNLPKNILEGVDLASIFADTSDPTINIGISKGFVIVSVQSDSGTFKFRAKIKYTGEDVSFKINPEFLKQMMLHSSSIVISEDKAKLETDDKSFSIVTALYK